MIAGTRRTSERRRGRRSDQEGEHEQVPDRRERRDDGQGQQHEQDDVGEPRPQAEQLRLAFVERPDQQGAVEHDDADDGDRRRRRPGG